VDDCSKLAPLGEGVALAQVVRHEASCVPLTSGGADCRCSTPDSVSMSLKVGDAPDDATCEDVVDFCAKDAVILPTSDASCAAQSQSTFDNTSCEADLSCQQAATINGRALVAEGRLLVRCGRAQPGQAWRCSCASDQTTATFQLGAPDASASEACDQAPAACLEHMDLRLGPYGELLYPPDPLLP
jgi:hypothetical protein